MIRSNDVYKEADSIDTEAKKLKADGNVFQATVLKACSVALRLLLNIRQNQVVVMKAQEIDLVQPKLKNNGEETEDK